MRFAPPFALAIVLTSWRISALDKQGSAHGGNVGGESEGTNVSGSVMLGSALYNPTYAFIVTAGGGGPRGTLRWGAERCHPHDLVHGPRIRHFNFVEVSIEPRGLHAYVIGLPKGERTFCRMEEFDLAWPDTAKASNLAPGAVPKHDLRDCYCADGAPPPAAGCGEPTH